VAAALAFALAPLLVAAADDKPAAVKTQSFTGKVVPPAAVLEKHGVKLDKDAGGLVLAGDDGKVYPLVKDDGARMFFKDARLRDRPMILEGRLLHGTPFLQVLRVRSVLKGKPHEVYYWCEVCAISRGEKYDVCECCGGPMELREVPVQP
jgi:hypothetical protein